jgi:hypothetical protein
MNRVRVTTTVAAVAFIGLTLAGCAPANHSIASVKVVPSSIPTPTPAPTAGAIVAQGTKLAANQKLYKLNSGKYVVVQSNLPLPDAVVEDIQANAKTETEMNSGRKAPVPGSTTRFEGWIQQAGKNACLIVHGIPDPTGHVWRGYAYFSPTANTKYFTTEPQARQWCITNTPGPADKLAIIDLNY